MKRFPATYRTFLLGVAVTSALLSIPPDGLQAQEPVRADGLSDGELLERFLDRVGLVEYQMLQLERLLEVAEGKREIEMYARRLADLYASQLLSMKAEAEEYEAMLFRIEQLVARYPQARTPALDVMLLQADFQRAERLMTSWLQDASEASRQQAETLLDRIAEPLAKHQRDLNQSAVDQEIALDKVAPESPTAEPLQRELTRTRELAARAAFLGGWANYYRGLVGSHTRDSYDAARRLFRGLLGIDGEDYRSLEADWLGLQVAGRARALIGLGLVEAGLDDLQASRQCFELLEHPSVAVAVREQAQQWYVLGLLQGGHAEEALQHAREVMESFGGKVTPGKVSLCVSLVREGFAPARKSALVVAPDVTQKTRAELGLLGLTGLARLGEIRILRELIEKYDIRLEQDSSDFFLLWIRGQQALDKARRTKSTEDFQTAVQLLESALSAPNAAGDVQSTTQCRMQLAWCHFQLANYDAAARQYTQAATGRRAAGDAEGAVRNLWNAFVSYEKVAKDQPASNAAAIEILKRIRQEYPDHEYAGKASYQLTRLQRRSGSSADSIRQLLAIPADDSDYFAARVDLHKLLHEQWSQSEKAIEQQRLGEQLRRSVEEYLATIKRRVATDPSAASGAAAEEHQLTALLLAADTLLRGPSRDVAEATRLLTRGQVLAESLSDDQAAKREYHYRLLLSARMRGESDEVHRHASWLADHAAGSAYELTSLVLASQALEKQIAASRGDEQLAFRRQALQRYRRLSQLLGDAPATLASNGNAQVAASRLAESLAALGQQAAAAAVLDKLLTAFPNEKSYLRRAAVAHFEAENYAASLNAWRTLLRGLPDDTPGWFEAKYHQLVCLGKTEPETASKVFRQFRLLHPDMGPDPWGQKIQAWSKARGLD